MQKMGLFCQPFPENQTDEMEGSSIGGLPAKCYLTFAMGGRKA
jgi:hypothetical protein